MKKQKDPCPICLERMWKIVGKRIYKTNDERWTRGYPKIQKPVFFRIWHRGRKEVVLSRCICKNCGFISDFPRPNKEEIREKYKYLSKVEKNLGSVKIRSKEVINNERKQSLEVLQKTSKLLKKKISELKILDLGGGDGHFLIPMKEEGARVYLVDYNENPEEGVIHLGKTLQDLEPNEKFDLIIIRHVIEHVANPREILSEAKNYLKRDGIIFAEVPIQIMASPNPNKDPVTHVNYFQEESFSLLFKFSDYKVLYSKNIRTTYHEFPMNTVKLFAKIGDVKISQKELKESYKKTLNYVYPSLRYKIRKKLLKFINKRKGLRRSKERVKKILKQINGN